MLKPGDMLECETFGSGSGFYRGIFLTEDVSCYGFVFWPEFPTKLNIGFHNISLSRIRNLKLISRIDDENV